MKKTSFAFSNLDKLYWENEKISKGDLIEYYAKISRTILPYLKNRPLVMHRYPEGIHGEAFYQKEAGRHLPSFVETATLQHTNKKVSYILVQNLNTLLYVANLGSIELHAFNASIQHLHKPDYLVVDLDPLDISFQAVVETALAFHAILEEIRVPHFCKTSGATGLHIYLPMHAAYDIDQIKQFAYLLATLVHHQLPSITSLERMPQKRKKRVYIDYLQNQKMLTMVSVYSVRARPGAPVSTPLSWKEVKRGLDPLDYTIKTVPGRIAKKGDLFKKILGKGVNLATALNRLEKW